MHDVVILGAGIHGLCAAFALRRRGLQVTVLDRFAAGHLRGGSHGAARIMRSSYHERRYVELARRAHREGWPRLEAELGRALVHPTPGLFFGPPTGPFGRFLAATLAAGVDVERLDVDAAVRRFPLLRFEPGDVALLDNTAGVIAAAQVIAGLREWLVGHGVEIRDGVAASGLLSAPDAVVLATSAGELRARAVVAATGAWLGELVPEWGPRLVALRQQIGYVQLDVPAAAAQVGTFPVWARIGQSVDEFDYGLPEFGRAGLKLGRHRTVGPADDPDAEAPEIDETALRALAVARLTAPVECLLATEHCLYSVAPDEEIHVGRAAADPRVVAVAACSGHGFKFGPVIGEQVADLLVGG